MSQYNNETVPSATPYLQGVQTDFRDANLRDSRPGSYPKTYADLHTLMDDTRKLFNSARRQLMPSRITPETEMGETIKEILSSNVEFTPSPGDCCIQAEQFLLASIAENFVEDTGEISPIIVTDGNEPLGIIKSDGLKSFYGITNAPEAGIVTAAFAKHTMGFRVEDLVPTSHAWRIDVTDSGAFRPLRLSTLAIEKGHKQQLAYLGKQTVKTNDHSDVVNAISNLLSSARPIGPNGKPL